MASIYPRKDSKELWLCCYPKPGKLVRASLGTEDQRAAERVRRKVELLLELERMQDVPVPEKILAHLAGLPRVTDIEPPQKKETADRASRISRRARLEGWPVAP